MKRRLTLWLSLLTLAGAQNAPSSPPAPVVLTLSAPVGSGAELRTLSTSSLSISDLQVSAVPGGQATPEQVASAQRSLQDGISAVNKAGATSLSGKAFFRVVSRDGAGNTTLLSSVVQTPPARAGQPARTLTMRLTQTIAPDGQVSHLTLDSDDPQVSAAFKGLTPEKLGQIGRDLNGNAGSVYGVPLQVNEPRTSTVTVDFQELMNSLLGALAGADARKIFGSFQSTPLTVTTTTTYRGTNAAGQHLFDSGSEYGPWKFSLSSQDARLPLNLSAELRSAQASGTSAYTATGLPAQILQKSNLSMQVQMVMDGIQVSMTMTAQQALSMQPR